jgi:hypothetical protein
MLNCWPCPVRAIRIPASLALSKKARSLTCCSWTANYMFWMALIGLPIVLTYTLSIYYVFRGKVTFTEESY